MKNYRGVFQILFVFLISFSILGCFSEPKSYQIGFNQAKESFISSLKSSSGNLVSLIDGYEGKALQCLGDSHFVESKFIEPISLEDGFTVSFRFNREDWINPYKKGRGSQTLLTLKSKTEQGIYNFTFSYNTYQDTMQVNLTAPRKRSIKLRSKQGVPAQKWHFMAISYDPSEEKYLLRLNDQILEFEEDKPQILDHPLTQIKFCTWFKMNQAYKGLIDDVQILSEGLSKKEMLKHF